MFKFPPLHGLRDKRREACMTQKSAGELIGKSQSHYMKIERGESPIHLHHARTLAQRFGVTIEELF